MKEFIYQIETLKMGIHFISFIIYLVAISWCSDIFHKKLKQNKKVDKEKTASGFNLNFDIEMKKLKRNQVLIIFSLGILHEFITWAKLTNFGMQKNSSLMFQLYIPPICVVISILILLVIFWLKGKGGGIPNNSYVNRTWPLR